MAPIFTTLGSLLLTVTLLPAAHALTRSNWVTWRQCKNKEQWGVVDTGTVNPKATILHLAHCRIKELAPGAFEGLPNLEAIFLDDNHITYIDLSVFSPVSNLSVLGLRRNKLCKVPAFNEYSLFPHMYKLNLSENLISAISNPDTFSSFQELVILDLGGNLIEYIHPDSFKPLKKLRDLDLSNNKISFITDTMFDIQSLKWLDLSSNSIEYVPSDAFHGSNLKELFIMSNRITHLPINFITSLQGAGVYIEKFRFYGNSWHCSCLLELLSELKITPSVDYQRSDSTFYLQGSQPECVFIGRFPCDRYVPLALLPFFPAPWPVAVDEGAN